MPSPSLSSLFARWEEAFDRGRDLSPEELAADSPDLLPALREGIAAMRRARQPGLDGPTAPPPSDPFETTAALPSGPAAAPSSDAPPGYEILGELGRGGMGVVYRARQVALNRVVALKMILSGGHAGTDERVRFLAEAEAIARVRHPGIIQVFDFGTHLGLPWFSLELCAGGSLAERLRDGPLPPREAAQIVEKVARVTQAAHDAGIVHRDLKPANVLLAADGSPRVTDFGLAKRTEAAGHTATGAIMGTPSYMAPEQAEGKKDVGIPADVYALGAMLYACLTGRPPFQAATAVDTIMQVVADDPVPVRRLNAKAPADLETICHKCLAKEPGRRYASAAEMADDLTRWLEGRPITARPAGLAERAVKWVRRNPMAAALGVALAAGVAVSSWFAFEARVEAKAATDAVTTALAKATYQGDLSMLAQALDSLPVRMETKVTARAAARAALARTATFLIADMAKTTDAYHLSHLTEEVGRLAPRLEAKEAKEAAAAITAAFPKTRTTNTYPALAITLGVLAGRMKAEDVPHATAQAAAAVMALLIQFEGMAGLAQTLDLMLWRQPPTRPQAVVAALGHAHPLAAPALLYLDPPPPPLPAQTLVDLLKHPFCVGEARTLVLVQLSRHYKRPFADQWDFVAHAEANKLPLDLASPWKPPAP